jgi:hypothetical protein
MNKEAPAGAADHYTLAEVDAACKKVGYDPCELLAHLLEGNVDAVDLLDCLSARDLQGV